MFSMLFIIYFPEFEVYNHMGNYTNESFISLGIIVDISELDVIAGNDEEGTGRNSVMSEADAQKQAEVYAVCSPDLF